MPSPIPTIPVSFGPHDADWWMVGLTAAGIIATLLIALLTLRANQTAGAAQITATNAYAAALEATQASSAKQVEALEVLVDRLNDAPTRSAPVSPVRWTLSRDGKNRWFFRNDGDETAIAASIRPVTDQDAQDLHVILEEPMDVVPGGQLPFAIWRSLASPPATLVELIWRDADEQERNARFVVSV